MRITILSPPPGVGGGIRVIATYAGRLQRRGHEVTLVYPPVLRPPLINRIRMVFRRETRRKLVPASESYYEGLDVRKIQLDRERPITAGDVPDADVVIATWWQTAEWTVDLPPEKGAKVYFLQHYEVHNYLPADRVRETWRLPLHKIVICKWLADLAAERFDDADASLVPNSVDTSFFDAPPRGKQTVPCVGMLYSRAHWKGTVHALDAIRIARESIPDLKAVVLSQYAPIRRLPLPPGAHCRVHPPQAEIPGMYSSCDAWLFSSISEGFGLPILESMACRTPVIGTTAGAAPELIGPGGGMLVEPKDPEAMAEAIVRLCGFSEVEWRAMSDIAYETSRQYTWDDATDLFENALVHAVEKARG